MKNLFKWCVISLIVLTGIAALSCTDGQFDKADGAGNLNIVGIPTEYNKKYISVSATIGANTLSFIDSGRIQITKSKGKVNDCQAKAPLYYSNGLLYDGNDTNVVFTIKFYQDKTTATEMNPPGTKNLTVTKFYAGSGLTNWTE